MMSGKGCLCEGGEEGVGVGFFEGGDYFKYFPRGGLFEGGD